jgi:hypothetical protein
MKRRIELATAVIWACLIVFNEALAQGAYQVYRYDSLGNLIVAWDSANRNAQFSLDPADNRTFSQVVSSAAPPQPAPPPSPIPDTVFRPIRTTTRTITVPALGQ